MQIIRPLNLGIIALTMLLIIFKYRDEAATDFYTGAFYLIFPALLTAAAGYIINDICDVETDKVNKPESRIVGYIMRVRTARIAYVVLNLSSLALSYLYSKQYAYINISIIALLYLYAIQLKGVALIGNVIVAMCSAAVLACCILYRSDGSSLIVFQAEGFYFFMGYIFFAFFISLIRELVKDIQDLEGDSLAGLRTYPVVFGIKGAKILIYSLTAIEIILCGLFSFLSWGVDFYASAVLMGLITFTLLYFINRLSMARHKEDFGFASNLLKGIMLAGVINLLFI